MNLSSNEVIVQPVTVNSEPGWPVLLGRAVSDLSRIVHAEFKLVELSMRTMIEQEIDRALKAVVALGLLLCAAICAVGAAVIGLHVLLGIWWAAFAITAVASAVAGMALFSLAMRRPAISTTIAVAESSAAS